MAVDMGQTTKVLIDSDPGVDDAIAILMALASSDLQLVGITTVGGNVPLARATRNTLALLSYTGRQNVPVARGAARPIQGHFTYSYDYHGRGGLSHRLPEPDFRPVNKNAVDFMAESLENNPGQITVVAMGPLTNLAHVLYRHPSALTKAASLVIMGGAVGSSGNITPYAEFNFYNDPTAANDILSSGLPLTLVDLRAGYRTTLARDEAQNLTSRTVIGRLAVRILNNWFRLDSSRQRFEFNDPLALAVALQPEVISTRQMALAVEIVDLSRIGMVRAKASGSYPVAVAENVNEQAFFRLLWELLSLI